VGKFAKQIELAFLYNVDWIGDREVITDVFILDLIFCTWCMLIPMIWQMVVW
jgi:hypothetical protein